MSKTKTECLRYILSECLKNLIRYRIRYIPYGIIVVLVSGISAAALSIGGQCREIVVLYKSYYAPEGYYIADEDVGMSLPVTKDDVMMAENTYMTSFRLFAALTLIETALTAYVAVSTANERVYETAVKILLGIPLKSVIASLTAELAIFIMLTSLAGMLTGFTAGAIRMGELFLNGSAGVMLIPAAAIILSAVIIYLKLCGMSPCQLLREEM